jgi:hypothetical protein
MKGLTTALEIRKGDADFSYEGKRPRLFWAVLRARAGMLIKLNLLLAIFALPAVAAIFYFTMQNTVVNVMMPHSAGLGLGYPVILDAAGAGEKLLTANNIFMHLGMTGAIALLCVVLSGGFYVMREIARGDIMPILKNFFVGVKKHFLPFLCAAPIIAGFYFLIAGGISAFNAIAMAAGLKIFLLVIFCLIALYLLCVAIFYFTQAVTYKIKVKALLKNSFILGFKLLPRSLFVLIFSAAPFVLLFVLLPIQIVNMIALMLAALFLFSFFILMWTIYAHWAFDTLFQSIDPNAEAAEEAVAENANTGYKKKKRKPILIDEAQIEPVDEASGVTESTEDEDAGVSSGAVNEEKIAEPETKAQKTENKNFTPQKKTTAYKFSKKK